MSAAAIQLHIEPLEDRYQRPRRGTVRVRGILGAPGSLPVGGVPSSPDPRPFEAASTGRGQ